MGVIGLVLGVPLLPFRGVIWLGGAIQQRVEHEMHDPGVARRQLEAVEEATRTGEVAPEAAAEVEAEVTARLAGPRVAPREAESER